MTGIYPGSFDPVTNGHMDIINRVSKLVDKLYVAILVNSTKNPLFTIEERIEMLNKLTKDIKNVEAISFQGLLIDIATEKKADVIIRGLRAVTDFEYEFQFALTNKTLNPSIETLFMASNSNYLFLSSSVVKEIACYGGSIDKMVPDLIKDELIKKYNKREA